MSKKDDYDKVYKKMALREQILTRPDTYVGSLEKSTEEMWVYNEEQKAMEIRQVTWVPGLYKIFDEILVNAADNKEKDDSQSKIMVEISAEEGYVKVWNNGEGVPVHMHANHKLYVPDMIFGHLLTSSHYDDSEKKTTGGRNGFGAKLANIFSLKFTVETVHTGTGKKFKKMWKNNMSEAGEAVISDVKAKDKDFTCVTFWPDFKRFQMDGFDDDTIAIFQKRVVDIAGCTDPSLKVYLNGKLAPVQKFQDYVDLFPGLGVEKMAESYACPNKRWQICIRPSNIDYQQISFVNSIWTIKGGQHVRHILDQTINKIRDTIKKKHKKLDIQSHNVKPFLWIFVNAKIENPAFDSQTKETLNTPKSKFGSSCEVPQKIIDSLCKVITERVLDRVNNKINQRMAADVASAGRARLVNVPKLDDANDAGTRNGRYCTLILTEGESAKSMVTAGLGRVGRDRFGCFPLRGKILNVRDSSSAQIQKCKEIQNLMKIIGLKPGAKYVDVNQLRYGSVMIMADQDHDGSHIKGLLINIFHSMWPGLLNVPGFLVQFITPIVKAFRTGAKRDKEPGISFFTIPDFVQFKEEQEKAGKKWDYKYYKGLGTSTTKEAKEYFGDLDTHKVEFMYDKESGEDDKSIVMAFSGKKIDERKKWITGYRPGSGVDYNIKQLGYHDFVHKELILYSIAACERAIPSVIDGLKPGQRKILFSAFKRNLTHEVKVAQFSGYVSEHAAYHHGEVNLQATIINLAQNYTGSNNLPYFQPVGMFGSRANGGKDHAAPRYIFTKLDPVTRAIFPKVDDNLLNYKDDDGKPVEPEYYIPIIPTALLNGQQGIGSGFATTIPNYNPHDLIRVTEALMKGEETEPLVPWYRGFTGKIKEGRAPGKFLSEGVVDIIDSSVVRVTELPVKYWTDDFKDELTKKQENGLILQFRNHITGDTVDVDIALRPAVLQELQASGMLLEYFGLVDHIHCTNLICFDQNHTLHKYETPEDIVKEWYLVRLNAYGERKKYLIEELEKTCEKLRNIVRFITEVNDGTINIRNKKRAVVIKELQERKYTPLFPQQKKRMARTAIVSEEEELKAHEEDPDDPTAKYFASGATAEEQQRKDPHAGGYEYLLSLKLWSITYERARQLEEQLKRAQEDLAALRKKTEKDMWAEDLEKLDKAIAKANKDWEDEMKDGGGGGGDDDDDYHGGGRKRGRGGKRKQKKEQTRLSERMVGKLTAKQAQEADKAWKPELEKLKKKVLAASKPKVSTKRKKSDDVEDEDDNVFDEDTKPKKPRTAASTKKSADPKPKKPAAKKERRKKKHSSDSDDDDNNDDSDTSFNMVKDDSSSAPTSDPTDSSDESDSDDNEDSEETIPKKKARKPTPKAKASRRKQVADDDDEDEEDEKPAPKKKSPPKKAAQEKPKARRRVSDDDDEEESDGEQKPKPAKKPAKKASPAKKESPRKNAISKLFDDDDLLNFDPNNFGLDKLKS